jgi:hypothetical protein
MKKYFFCFFLLIGTGFTTISGQIPFLDSTYTWTEAIFGGFTGEVITRKYKFAAEPFFLNGNFYFEIFSNDQESGGTWKNTGLYLRYENNMIYEGNNTEDFAIIDFNLPAGEIFYNPFGATYMVTAVDSITLENGERRKRQEVQCDVGGPVTYYWIEGVGSTGGLALNNLNCVTDIGGALLCVHKNDTLVYQNPEFNSCWITIVSSKEIIEENLTIFPNPAYIEISINANQSHIVKVSIIDLMGNIIFVDSEPTANISFLPPGYYFMRIEMENEQAVMKRFVKI